MQSQIRVSPIKIEPVFERVAKCLVYCVDLLGLLPWSITFLLCNKEKLAILLVSGESVLIFFALSQIS